MTTTFHPSPDLLPALVNAGIYATAQSADDDSGRLPSQALADIRRARVEIYCDHSDLAVRFIRGALLLLRTSSHVVPANAMASLAQAEWLARHGRYMDAEQALDLALDFMASSASMSA